MGTSDAKNIHRTSKQMITGDSSVPKSRRLWNSSPFCYNWQFEVFHNWKTIPVTRYKLLNPVTSFTRLWIHLKP